MLRHPVFQLTHMWLAGCYAMPGVARALAWGGGGVRDFPGGGNPSGHAPPLTYLA